MVIAVILRLISYMKNFMLEFHVNYRVPLRFYRSPLYWILGICRISRFSRFSSSWLGDGSNKELGIVNGQTVDAHDPFLSILCSL
jgi:hypothetical protein